MKKLLLISSFVLPGCASIVSGPSQTVSVDTAPLKGASCTLANDKGTWIIPETPGTTTVQRAYGALQVTCTKEGYGSGTTSVESSTKGMAFGNIIVGGGIGAVVDCANGSAYDYPEIIMVDLKKADTLEAIDAIKKVESPQTGEEIKKAAVSEPSQEEPKKS